MTQELFYNIWNDLTDWNSDCRRLHELGVDILTHEAKLYKLLLLLLKEHFNETQIDFMAWSIFDNEKILPTDNGDVIVYDADTCWKYINILKDEKI